MTTFETTTNTLDYELVVDAAGNLDLYSNAVLNDYVEHSGGPTCFAVVLPSHDRAWPFLVELTALLTEGDRDRGLELARGLAEVAKTDSLGYDVVLYFPGWTLTDD